MTESLPHRVRTLFDGAITAALRTVPLGGSESEVDDIDGALDLTGPLAIPAPRRFGDSDLVVFPLALNTAALAGVADRERAFRVLDRHRALGGTMLDTTDEGPGAAAQELVGAWLARPHADRADGPAPVITARIGRGSAHGLGPVSMVRAVEGALARLGVDHLDVLYLEGDGGETPLADSLATAEWLIESGKVRWVGAAGVGAERLMEARVLASTGLPKLIAVQAEYNLVDRRPFEAGLRIVAAGQELAVSPTRALAGGFLAGRGRPRANTPAAGRAVAHLGRHGARVLQAVERVAEAHDTTPTSIALAWLLAKRNVAAPVAAATTPAHVDSLMVASSIRLTRAQMLDLDRASE